MGSIRRGSSSDDELEELFRRMAASTRTRVGVDIGKLSDPSAIVVTEEEKRDGIAHYLVRSIERLPLGTSYPAVANRVVEIMNNLQSISDQREQNGGSGFVRELIVDGTGVGLPVVDLVKERGLKPTVAMFTGTEKMTVHPDDVVTIGKAWMVSRLQTLLQAERLHLPDTAEAPLIAAELLDYQIDVNNHGHASFNARRGKHDDLVVALGLSVGDGKPPVGGAIWVRPMRVKIRW